MTRPNTHDSESVDIRLPDGSTSTVLLFGARAEDTGSAGEAKPLVVIWPGFGMGARYFKPMASWLAERGFPTAVGELRGQGSSTAIASRTSQWGYHTMVTEDYPLTIAAAKKALGVSEEYPVILLTHSMGGQVGVLFLGSEGARCANVIGMMGVGSGSPFWRSFRGGSRVRIGGGSALMGAISRVVGHWPAGRLDVAGYGRQSALHVGEWARLARTNKLDHIQGADYPAALAGVSVPVLLTRFNNDEDCTLASAEALAAQLSGAPVEVEELAGGLGHNRWAREPETVGQRFVKFYEEKLRD
ncbi:alpha/beta fold hydrolase [Corynebacterium sp.]|uniref:alpha/beta fold hydrolase n=1 Tax=Corynebacterium sp. TaxID=1720 RepID=UPI002A91C4A4|nr:alpha/beta fold hydrolase [Corynebacterium sp.]MDY5785560.1 alpha/beta fold hydrolase [Corynebacterium sp.]